MIQKKYSSTLFIIIMAFGMSVIMSGVVTAINTGLENRFLERHFNSFIFAFPVGLIAAFTMAPISKILADKIASK
jgi:hypothetical protein|tara:strand:+ start:1013 stop:1237 length:225 start_codon:yes stop_codon:yes gene_type:complete